MHRLSAAILLGATAVVIAVAVLRSKRPEPVVGHGTVIYPASRAYRVYKSNPERPNFALAANAVKLDGKSAYYTWNEVSRNIPAAVQAKLPPGFDYSKWIPDGQLASAGRIDGTLFPRTYAGLDQVSADWPTTPVKADQTIIVTFLATAPHDPSVWDVWMTKPGWTPKSPLTWKQMQFLGRPTVSFKQPNYSFSLKIPKDRQGHHVLWIAWQRNDPVGEVFISTSDLMVEPQGSITTVAKGCGATLTATGTPTLGGTLQFAVTGVQGTGQLLWAGISPISQTMCAGCALGTTFDYVFVGGKLTTQVPNNTRLIGLTLYAQGADIGVTKGGCALGGGTNYTLTDTLRTVIGW